MSTIPAHPKSEFWRFWKWQYIGRNEKYLEAYWELNKVLVGSEYGSKYSVFLNSCNDKFGWMPTKDPEEDSDSERILLELWEYRKKKQIKGFLPYPYDVDLWGLGNGNVING